MTYTIIGGDKKEYGPISSEDIRQWISEGRLNGQTLAKSVADSGWRTLASYPEFADVLGASAPPPTIGPLTAAPPLPSAPGTVDLERDYELDIGGCVSQGWALYKENFGTLFVTLLMVLILSGVAGGIANLILTLIVPKQLMENEIIRQAVHNFLLTGLAALVAGPLMGGMYRVYLQRGRNQPVEFGEVAFSGFSKGFLALFLGYLAIAWMNSICMIPYNAANDTKLMPILEKLQNQPSPQDTQNLMSQMFQVFMSNLPVLLICLVPLTYLVVSFQFTIPLIADKQMKFCQALKASWIMTHKHWLSVFGLTIVLGLVAAAGVLACCIGVLFTIPISVAGLMAAYETIFGTPRKS